MRKTGVDTGVTTQLRQERGKRVTGVEPATLCLASTRSSQLSYTRVERNSQGLNLPHLSPESTVRAGCRAGMTEPAVTLRGAERIDFSPTDTGHRSDDELGDAVAPFHLNRFVAQVDE